MERSIEELEREVARLQRANSEFVSVVSHEFKTPLTGVKLFADLLLAELEHPDIDTQRKYLNIIKAEADRMERSLNNAIDFLDLSEGTIVWRDAEVDIVRLCDRCAALYRTLCETKGLDFLYHCRPREMVMKVDAERFTLLIYNLLANALRFTSAGEILFQVEVVAESEEVLSIEVRDTGSGMDSVRLDGLLCFGEALDIRRGKGLYVVDAIVRHYGGLLDVESCPGSGTLFRVSLPILD